MTSTAPTAVVLFAHGSRDPMWRAPIDAVANEMKRQSPQVQVHCAFLELTTPDLPSLVRMLVGQGHRCLRVVPMFLGIGRHAREDLPKLLNDLRIEHPDLILQATPPVGEMSELTRCIARLALNTDTPS